MGEERRFKAELNQLVPILVTTGLSLFFSAFLYLEGFQPFEILPFSESGVGPLLNAGYFVAFLLATAFILYFLLRFRKRLFKALVASSFIISIFTVTTLYTSTLFGSEDISLQALVLSSGITALAAVAIFKLGPLAQALTIMTLGSSLGAFLGVLTPTISALVLMLALSLYDIYAVHKGPIGKMVGGGPGSPGEFKTLFLSFKEINIGLGDLVFYSLLASHFLFYFGPIPALAAIAGILIGAFITLKLLEAEKILPGLPLSLSLGVIVAFLVLGL